jgi:CRISPR-associated endonuclease/helicase Cas3
MALSDHLAQTETTARALTGRLGSDIDLTEPQREAIFHAALLHDLGKAHPTFQLSLTNANLDVPPPNTDTVWANPLAIASCATIHRIFGTSWSVHCG